MNEKRESWRLFDQIAKTYDFLNHLLSFGIDKLWRKKMAGLLPEGELRVLDLATGTGDVLLALFKKRGKEIKEAVGLDPSKEMLKIAKQKLSKKEVTLVLGSAGNLPFEDNAFEAVTMAFGIRNVSDVDAALLEIRRVLSLKGKALILEFSTPKNGFVRSVHFFYLRHILPLIGGLISGKKSAYIYLNETIEAFPTGDAFLCLMEKAGLKQCKAYPLTFGIATLYVGEKE